jgi:hypothetical protein
MKALSYFSVFLLGVLFSSFFSLSLHDYRYFQTERDYYVSEHGYIKAGTILRMDKGFSEGFTRYILYLNLKNPDVKELPSEEHFQTVIPIWLREESPDSVRAMIR